MKPDMHKATFTVNEEQSEVVHRFYDHFILDIRVTQKKRGIVRMESNKNKTNKATNKTKSNEIDTQRLYTRVHEK